jgi:hypothetical protein
VGEREEEISSLEAMLSGNATSTDVENRKKKSTLKVAPQTLNHKPSILKSYTGDVILQAQLH